MGRLGQRLGWGQSWLFGKPAVSGFSEKKTAVSGFPAGFLGNHFTLHQGCTQVRFWIQFKIPTEYVRLMPRLPENVKIKIPQVGSLTNKS